MSMDIQLQGTRLIKVVASGKEETQTTYYHSDLIADSECRHLVMAEQKARGFVAALEVYLRYIRAHKELHAGRSYISRLATWVDQAQRLDYYVLNFVWM